MHHFESMIARQCTARKRLSGNNSLKYAMRINTRQSMAWNLLSFPP